MYCSRCGELNNDESRFCKDCGNALGVQQSEGLQHVVFPASLIQRFVHKIVDSVAMYLFAFAVGFLALELFGDEAGFVIGLTAFFTYHLIFEALFQKTVGKMLTGTKVVNVNGEKPSLLALTGRTLARYLPFEPFSFLFYGLYPTKGWHDRLSGTLVVPKDLTSEQVRAINQNKIDEQKNSNSLSIILILILGGFLFIAVIGILSAVVIGSLNDARSAGQDASAKQLLGESRLRAELYHTKNNSSYDGFCSDPETKSLFSEYEYSCNDSSSKYVVTLPLNEGGYFCVDSDGSSKVIGEPISFSQQSCNGGSGFDTPDTKESLYQELKDAEKYAKSMIKLPVMVDEETRLERIFASINNKMNYDYSLVNYEISELDWTELEKAMMPIIKKSFCNDTAFEFYRGKNVPMVWNYYDKNKILVGSIELTANDCK